MSQVSVDSSMEFYLSETPLEELGPEYETYRRAMERLMSNTNGVILQSFEYDNHMANFLASGTFPHHAYFFRYKCVVEPLRGTWFHGEVRIYRFKLVEPRTEIVPEVARFSLGNVMTEPLFEVRKIDAPAIFELHLPRLITAANSSLGELTS